MGRMARPPNEPNDTDDSLKMPIIIDFWQICAILKVLSILSAKNITYHK
jgi:hypothetical protein